jgi:predicted RND superfamily exporter protein
VSEVQQNQASGRLEDFDRSSGSLLERLIFNNRLLVIALCIVVSAVLGLSARHVELNTSFESFIPSSHPFVTNYLRHKDDVRGLSNTLRIVVETNDSIFNRQYLETLRNLNDEIFLLSGVDRAYMRSIWTPATRWLSVTEDGMEGGPIMPPDYDGSPAGIATLRANIEHSSEIGQLVAADFKSSIIRVPLFDVDAATGKNLDYGKLSRQLESIRAKYQSDGIRIHIVGFAKIVGDLIEGLNSILAFFVISIAIAVVVLFLYTRCVRSTALVVFCSLVAVGWQLGALPLFKFKVDPYSILVPFLVFAIGMSHGAQKMNGIMQDIGRGVHRLVAARMTFRRLFLAGFTALVCDAFGFAVLLVIDIPSIRQLAMVASLGVAILIFTNLILLPILLSYTGVSLQAAQRSLRADAMAAAKQKHVLWAALDLLTGRRGAWIAVSTALVLGATGYVVGRNIQVGDLDEGAPELRRNSTYNRDNAYLIHHYSTSTDVFLIMVETPPNQCGAYATLADVDFLEENLRDVPGVEATVSLADLSRQLEVGFNEGALRWFELVPNQESLNEVITLAHDLYNQSCSLESVFLFLRDHKAQTLTSVVDITKRFAAGHPTPGTSILLAAGNAGIEAATNIVVKQANRSMLLYIYAAVLLLSLITFRSWRAVLAAVLPLMLTSVLAEALMVCLGIGVKVATLPVTALGVGIGVDYSLYILSVTLVHLRNGATLSEAYYRALLFTGKVVMLTGFTLATAVATWAFSPIKFQADMGILLAFMFLVNMVGSLVLLPALAHFLLRPSAFPRSAAASAVPNNGLSGDSQ